jgi:hypothetical protein
LMYFCMETKWGARKSAAVANGACFGGVFWAARRCTRRSTTWTIVQRCRYSCNRE